MPYVEVLQKYAEFDGRAKRSEFWLFMLVHIIISVILAVIAAVGPEFLAIVPVLYGLALLVPQLAVGSRRLHDTGKSGWLQLILLVPFIGWIIVLILMVLPGQGENKYGPVLG